LTYLGLDKRIPLGSKYYDPDTKESKFKRAKIDHVFQIATGWAHALIITKYGLFGSGTNRDNQLGINTFIAEDDQIYFRQIPIPGLIDL
jgi:alpha-tubulin suppressor-like RCC1 family protein